MSLQSPTLLDVLRVNAQLHGSRLAFRIGEQCVTHAQYLQRIRRLANGLAAAGVQPTDRIALLAPNNLDPVDLLGAAAYLGAILVPINTRLSADEVSFIVADVSPCMLFVASELQALVSSAATAVTQVHTLGTDGGLQALHRDGDTPPAEAPARAPLVIIHTAAVAGRPRGAMLSHAGLLAAGKQHQLLWQITPDDVHLGALPLYHVGGLGLLLATQIAGGTTLLMPKFDPQAVVRHSDHDGGSVIGTFPPMLDALLEAAAAQGSQLKNLRVVSGIDSSENIARLRAMCPRATFWSVYGQTETSGPVSLCAFDEKPGSAGRPTLLNRVAVVDDLDRCTPPGVVGEIVVQGPSVFLGYWRCDEDNARTGRNGWHHTGDLGRIDADGYLWYEGRSPAKELIKPGGENVYPDEVERVIAEHPAVQLVAVLGVSDPQWGEAVKAVCVLKAGRLLAASELIEFVGSRIARYKKPRHVVFVESLPLTADGALDRAALKAAHGHA